MLRKKMKCEEEKIPKFFYQKFSAFFMDQSLSVKMSVINSALKEDSLKSLPKKFEKMSSITFYYVLHILQTKIINTKFFKYFFNFAKMYLIWGRVFISFN